MKSIAIFKRYKPLLSLLIFGFFCLIIKEQISDLNYQEVVLSLSTIKQQNIFWAIIYTLACYSIMANYDLIAFRHLNYKLDNFKSITTAFSSYSISNNTGFALLIGGGIRYYFYSYYGVPNQIIAQIILMSNFNFWLGFVTLGGITFTIKPIVIPTILQTSLITVRPIGIILLLCFFLYIYASCKQKNLEIKGKKLIIPSWRISSNLIVIAFLDRAIAALVLFTLLPAQNNISYGDFFSIYFLAVHAGIMSHIPGGIGIFEAVIIYLLPQTINTTEVLGSLIAFRTIYYLLPLAIACILIVIHEIRKKDLANY